MATVNTADKNNRRAVRAPDLKGNDLPLVRTTAEQFGGILKRLYSPRLKVSTALIRGQNQFKRLIENHQMSYPALTTKITSIDLNNESGYNRTVLKNGIQSGIHPDGRHWTFASLTPVNISLEIRFHSDDYEHAITFAEMWHQFERRLTFALVVGKLKIWIQTWTQPDLQIPDEAFEGTETPGEGNFEIITTANIKGYTGSVYFIPVTARIQTDHVLGTFNDTIKAMTVEELIQKGILVDPPVDVYFAHGGNLLTPESNPDEVIIGSTENYT